MAIVKCEVCGKEFTKDLNQLIKTKHNFCSRVCFGIARSKKIIKLPPRKITPNKIIRHSEYSELIIDSEKYGIKYCKIDNEDIDKITKHRWALRYDKGINNFYLMCKHLNKSIHIHRIITNCPDGLVVDHLNHDTLDNRKKNLKVCTQQDNMQNKNIQKNNKSGYSDVLLRKNGKYQARYTFNKKRMYLGMFNTLEDAVNAINKTKG